MKNYFLLLLAVFVSFNLNSQEQIYWTEVSLEVTPGKAPLVYKLVDDFYSSIDFPEGSALTLNAIQNKSEWTDATHFLNFAGTPDGLAQLRELRSGDEYEAYVENLEGLAKIVAMKQGQSLVRIQGENGNYSENSKSFAEPTSFDSKTCMKTSFSSNSFHTEENWFKVVIKIGFNWAVFLMVWLLNSFLKNLSF